KRNKTLHGIDEIDLESWLVLETVDDNIVCILLDPRSRFEDVDSDVGADYILVDGLISREFEVDIDCLEGFFKSFLRKIVRRKHDVLSRSEEYVIVAEALRKLHDPEQVERGEKTTSYKSTN